MAGSDNLGEWVFTIVSIFMGMSRDGYEIKYTTVNGEWAAIKCRT